jgi:hypothetical protein
MQPGAKLFRISSLCLNQQSLYCSPVSQTKSPIFRMARLSIIAPCGHAGGQSGSMFYNYSHRHELSDLLPLARERQRRSCGNECSAQTLIFTCPRFKQNSLWPPGTLVTLCSFPPRAPNFISQAAAFRWDITGGRISSSSA